MHHQCKHSFHPFRMAVLVTYSLCFLWRLSFSGKVRFRSKIFSLNQAFGTLHTSYLIAGAWISRTYWIFVSNKLTTVSRSSQSIWFHGQIVWKFRLPVTKFNGFACVVFFLDIDNNNTVTRKKCTLHTTQYTYTMPQWWLDISSFHQYVCYSARVVLGCRCITYIIDVYIEITNHHQIGVFRQHIFQKTWRPRNKLLTRI